MASVRVRFIVEDYYARFVGVPCMVEEIVGCVHVVACLERARYPPPNRGEEALVCHRGSVHRGLRSLLLWLVLRTRVAHTAGKIARGELFHEPTAAVAGCRVGGRLGLCVCHGADVYVCGVFGVGLPIHIPVLP